MSHNAGKSIWRIPGLRHDIVPSIVPSGMGSLSPYSLKSISRVCGVIYCDIYSTQQLR